MSAKHKFRWLVFFIFLGMSCWLNCADVPDPEADHASEILPFVAGAPARDAASPNSSPELVCDANGPYHVACQGDTTSIQLDGTGSHSSEPESITYLWSSDCPGASFDDPTLAEPILTVDTSSSCDITCTVTLEVDDNIVSTELCEATVIISESSGAIDIEKMTNGEDADEPPGVEIPVGDPVVWTYVVTNTGQVPLTEIVVVDDQGVAVSCPATSLEPDELMTCTADGVAVDGQYGNIGKATGHDPTGALVVDSDPSHYFGGELPLMCDAGGPYEAQCAGESTTIQLDGTGSSSPDGTPLTYEWTTDCPGGTFDDNTSPTPLLEIDTTQGCAIDCNVMLTVADGVRESVSCEVAVAVSDTTPPVIELIGDETITVECHTGTYTDPGATVSDACDTGLTTVTVGGDVVDVDMPGTYVVTYDATDACGNAAVQVTRTVQVVDTTPPVIELIGDATMTLECHTGSYEEPGATVSDACDTSLTMATVGGDVVDVDMAGTYIVTYDATDTSGNAAAQVTRTVQVVDTMPPEIIVADMTELWPPNHKYHTFKLSDLVSAEDACEGPLDVDAAGMIVSIYSDEPEDVTGNGDGNTLADIVILSNNEFKVRAERQGAGNGRVYGVMFSIVDSSGNEIMDMLHIGVPHDQSGAPPVDDGPGAGYTVP